MCASILAEVTVKMTFSSMFFSAHFAESKHIKYFDGIFAPVTYLGNHLSTQRCSASHPNRFENEKRLLLNEVPLFLELLFLS